MTASQPEDPAETAAWEELKCQPTEALGGYIRKAIDDGRVTVFGPHPAQIEERERAAYDRGLAEGRRQATEGKRLVVEWGARVDEPHPARHEKAGDVIKLGKESARHAPTIWAGWTTMRRERLVGPWEPEEARDV